MKPGKEEILAEAKAALEYSLRFIPVGWKFGGFKVVNSRDIGSKVTTDPGADGGRTYKITYSTNRLDEDWKCKIYTRTAHEVAHVRTEDIDDIDELREVYCEIIESLMMELYKSRSPQQTTTHAA